MDTIVQRLKKYLDFIDVSVSVAEKKINLSNGSLSKPFNANTTIKTDTLEKFLNTYPELNPEWLLTGQGSMLKEQVTEQVPVPVAMAIASKAGIPLIPIEAMAGYMAGGVQVLEYEAERFVVPTFKGADYLIAVRGSSMYPKYNSGDIVACKHLALDTFFQWNKVYVLDTQQGVLIKRICEGPDDLHILIVSENEKYKPFKLHRNEIHSLAIVLGVIRLE